MKPPIGQENQRRAWDMLETAVEILAELEELDRLKDPL